eukprot:scaffold11069_cov93-Skeletonema_marinoi.AAC.5
MAASTTATSSSAVALLLLFISLSPVSAGAFSCSSPSALAINKQHPLSRVPTVRYTGSSGGLFTTSASARIMKESPRSVLCLSELALIRGGDQNDVESESSGDTTDADINMKRVYGTNNNDNNVIDEESPSATVEMTAKSTTSLKSKKSDLSSDDVTILSSSRMALSTVLSPISSILAAFATFYTGQLTARPIITKALTAGMIQAGSFSIGAWIKKVKNDLPAVWASALFGLFIYRWCPIVVEAKRHNLAEADQIDTHRSF